MSGHEHGAEQHQLPGHTTEARRSRNEHLSKFQVEWHRKPMLAPACLIFFFIGAPLGPSSAKGGMGLPPCSPSRSSWCSTSSRSVRTSGDRRQAHCLAGHVDQTLVLLPVGLFLTWKAASDSPLLDRDAYYRGWEKLRSRFSRHAGPSNSVKTALPARGRGQQAMHNLTTGLLKAGHEVVVRCISTPKHPMRTGEIPEAYRRSTDVRAVFVDTSLNIVDAFTDLIHRGQLQPEPLLLAGHGHRTDPHAGVVAFHDIILLEPVRDALHRHREAIHPGAHRAAFAQPGACRYRNVSPRAAQPAETAYRRFTKPSSGTMNWRCWRRIDRVAAISSSDLAISRATCRTADVHHPVRRGHRGLSLQPWPRQVHPHASTWEAWTGCQRGWHPVAAGRGVARAIAERPGLQARWPGTRCSQDLLEARIPGEVPGPGPRCPAVHGRGPDHGGALLSAGGMRVNRRRHGAQQGRPQHPRSARRHRGRGRT